MKTSVLNENLSRAVKFAAYVIPKRPQLQVLGHVLLAADDAHLTVSATNLECGLSYRMGAKTEVNGAITVPPSAIDRTGDTRIDLALDKKRQILECVVPGAINGPKDRRYTVKGIQASEFPVVPAFDHLEPPVVTVGSSKAFRQAIKYVCEVESDWEDWELMTGRAFVSLHADGETLTLAAASDKRTHRAALDAHVEKSYSVALPVATLKLLAKILTDKTDVRIYDCGPEYSRCTFAFEDVYKQTGMRVQTGNAVELLTQTIDTPRTVAGLPDHYPFAVRVWPNQVDRALKRCQVFNAVCTLSLERIRVYDVAAHTLSKGVRAELSAESDALGDVRCVIDVTYDLLPPVRELQFNSAALQDALENMAKITKGQPVTLRLTGERSPVLIEAEGEGVRFAAAVAPDLTTAYSYVPGKNIAALVEAEQFRRRQDDGEALAVYDAWLAENDLPWRCDVRLDWSKGRRSIDYGGRPDYLKSEERIIEYYEKRYPQAA